MRILPIFSSTSCSYYSYEPGEPRMLFLMKSKEKTFITPCLLLHQPPNLPQLQVVLYDACKSRQQNVYLMNTDSVAKSTDIHHPPTATANEIPPANVLQIKYRPDGGRILVLSANGNQPPVSLQDILQNDALAQGKLKSVAAGTPDKTPTPGQTS